MSISAPKMTIKRHLPWPLRAVFLAVVVGLGGAVAMWAYDLGRNNFSGLHPDSMKEQVAQLSEQVKTLNAEREQYTSTANASESQMNIERSAQAQLATQVKTLVAENAKLKEDLSFFESLLPTNVGAQGITIQRLKSDIVLPNQVHYQLLAIKGGNSGVEFVGNLQLIVTVLQGGKSVTITFPEQNASATEQARYRLVFKYYQRVEGVVTLPEGSIIKAVQARVLERGQIRAQQSVNL
jgi:outer membrane murein-binding lipoprotein Lpp